MMKFVVILLSLVAYVSVKAYPQITSDVSAFGYYSKYGIPAAEKIRLAEEEYLNNPQSRIVGGSPADVGQFNYQAGLIADIVGIPQRGICGANLVSTNRLLTAAHCWFDGRHQAWRFTVVLGSNLLYHGGTRVLTTDVITHPLWFPLLILNDIAVIRLPSAVTLSDTIGTVALPTGSLSTQLFEGEDGTASGFGVTTTNGNITNDQFLSHVTMTIIPNSECRNFFPVHVRDSNICTRTVGGKSTCSGDSGGPLVVERSGTRVLVGITSFGSGFGCEIWFPAVFVRVTSFLDFINQNL